MPDLLIKNLPDELRFLLKARAAANNRSLQAEALALLKEALRHTDRPPSLREIDELRARPARPLSQATVDRARAGGRV